MTRQEAWDNVNRLIDEGKGGTPEYQAAWDEWMRIAIEDKREGRW